MTLRGNLGRLAASLVAAAGLTGASLVHAADLLQVWQAASQNDRGLAVARAAQGAAQPRLDQADALWRPSVGLSATVGIANQDSAARGAQFSAPGLGTSAGVDFNTSVSGGTATRWAIQASQPLYNPERRAQQRQLRLSAEMSGLEWRAAQQGLMLATAQRYFELALADENLRVLQRQLETVQRMAEEARDRFKLGASPITDTHEAEARLAGLRAQVLMAQTEARLKRRVLADSTGLAEASLSASLPAAPTAVAPAPLEQWLGEAEAASPALQMQRLAVEMARQEASKQSLQAAPRVDLVAQMGRDHLSGNGDFGKASNTGNQALLGVQLNVPLYTGGMRDARQREALQQLERAQAELEQARQQLEQQVRASWWNLSVGAERLTALAQAIRASEVRREATQLGREVGDRSTLDLLNAENDAAAAALAQAQARVALVMERLRLAQLAGSIQEETLRQVNAGLAAP